MTSCCLPLCCVLQHGPTAPADPTATLPARITLFYVNSGSLVVHQRSPAYRERRQDGYQEPQLVFIVGTAHVSEKSAEDVRRVIEVSLLTQQVASQGQAAAASHVQLTVVPCLRP